jgi:hypothetical protein
MDAYSEPQQPQRLSKGGDMTTRLLTAHGPRLTFASKKPTHLRFVLLIADRSYERDYSALAARAPCGSTMT